MRVQDYRARHAVPSGEKVRKVANNTIEHVDSWDRRRIILHETAILVFDPGGRYVRFNTGGWKSKTTKERMETFLPAGFQIFQKDFAWYLITPKHPWENPLPFADGRTLDLVKCDYIEPWASGGMDCISLEVESHHAR